MKISRREFLKWSLAATAALKLNYDMDKFNIALAADTDPPIIWLNGSSCSGCTISMLNVTNPTTIDDVLLNKLSMKYNTTLMTSSGESAMQALENAANTYKGAFILVVEGSIPTGSSENYCIIGKSNGVDLTIRQAILKYGPLAKYVVGVGTCSSFGGVPAAATSSTYITLKNLLTGKTVNPVVNISGCPVHPTVLVQTLIDLVLTGIPKLDSYSRPTKYYGTSIHSNCPRKGTTQVKQAGLVGCYKPIGCKGPGCKNVCPVMKWNNGQQFCITANRPCIGCADPAFPTNPIA